MLYLPMNTTRLSSTGLCIIWDTWPIYSILNLVYHIRERSKMTRKLSLKENEVEERCLPLGPNRPLALQPVTWPAGGASMSPLGPSNGTPSPSRWALGSPHWRSRTTSYLKRGHPGRIGCSLSCLCSLSAQFTMSKEQPLLTSRQPF